MVKDVMILTLENQMNNQYELYRIKKNCYLRLAIGHSLQGKSIRLFSNYPMTSNIFIRNTYSELEIMNPTISRNQYDSFDNYAEFKTTLSGAFQFYFTEDGSSDIDNKIGEGYFIIDPRFNFYISELSKEIYYELDGIVLQTYLAKNLGPFSEWQHRIEPALVGNYNMIHFTPLQELGYSRSAYSLRNQLRVNPCFSTTWDDIEKFIDKLYQKHQCLSMTDLVYNHSSNDSPWIHEHPECSYNVVNSPHLRPAYLLDRVVWNLTTDICNKRYTDRGLSDSVTESYQLDIIRSILWERINELKLHEFYLAHIDNEVASFREFLRNIEEWRETGDMKDGPLVLDHNDYRRLKSGVDHAVVAFHFYRSFLDIDAACIKYRELLKQLNDDSYRQTQAHLEAAVTNVLANIRYRFTDEHGLKLRLVSEETPLMWNYFYHPHADVVSLADCEKRMEGEQRIMAFNGWVMNDDPLSNFAERPSNVYFRRELIVWGDSVKLRYGQRREDCPYLWDHMFEYTELTARLFHAVRLDNCHGTPIHVAQAMLDRARAVRPDLYIVAELFTGSEGVDNVFVNRLGINSLIREAQSAWDPHEEGRLVHRFGGFPVGAFVQQTPRALRPSTAHALFYDMTHDNPSPVEKRSAFDVLPCAAVVGMACCAIGSTRGYDEIVPHYIDVVKEERLYSRWDKGEISIDTGIVQAKAVINKLHKRLAVGNYNQVFVDQLDGDVIAVTRLDPNKHRSVVTVAHNAFNRPHNDQPEHRHVREIRLSGRVASVLFEARTKLRDGPTEFKRNDRFINGLSHIGASVRENIAPTESQMVRIVRSDDYDTIEFVDLPPGSVVSVEVVLDAKHYDCVARLVHGLALQFNAKLRSSSMGHCLHHELMVAEQISKIDHSESHDDIERLPALRELLGRLTIVQLNRLLYRCHEEENSDFPGVGGSYDVPNSGRFVFCGLQGIVSELGPISSRNDLGHPICANLRDGNWLMNYVAERLFRYGGELAAVGKWFNTMFDPIRKLPRYMVPSLFEMVVASAHKLALEECFYQLGDNIVCGSSFVKNLALGSIMLCSVAGPSSALPPVVAVECDNTERCSLSAGFPHFAEGIWRNWGRDTFIALKGVTILTNRFAVSRSIILMYAATMRHGLIPNLLGDGLIARYNARDATWFWLNSIKEYELSQSRLVPNNRVSIMNALVARMYPTDGSDGRNIKKQVLADVMQEVLQRHADGIKFTERNAGPQIDNQMMPAGFEIVAGIRNSVKFPFGGNRFNCGTWMDKMGSSSKAGNKGLPATPRDGSAVEIVGLCASVLEWLIEASNNKQYPYAGVNFGGHLLTWNDWYSDLKKYFDDMFFIPLDATEEYLVHNRGIYRDTVNSSLGFPDWQFKPNFVVAMTVAPSLFNPEHAWHALELVEKELLGPFGMRTLSPRDWAYRGYYDNSNDSDDMTVAHGFNYHQGPEWVWLTGFYLQARLTFCERIFATDTKRYATVVADTVGHVQSVLGRLDNYIKTSKWCSLPELTNKDGAYCGHSCEAQAWSIGSTLEALTLLLSMSH